LGYWDLGRSGCETSARQLDVGMALAFLVV